MSEQTEQQEPTKISPQTVLEIIQILATRHTNDEVALHAKRLLGHLYADLVVKGTISLKDQEETK